MTIPHPGNNFALVRVTIEPGTYDGESLASAIQKGLTFGPQAMSGLPFAASPFGYTVHFDPKQNQIQISKKN